MEGTLFSIWKGATKDGPGIRTVVALKGCPLRCVWCHSPESWSYAIEKYSNGETVGGKTTPEKVVEEVLRDKAFYDASGGGITLSGGEVLVQAMEYITGLMKELHRKGYSVDIDTCGHVPWSRIENVLPYTDVFLYDIKGMDPDTHREYTGQDNSLILENLKRLASAGAKISIRMPLIAGLNDTDGDIIACAAFLRENAVHPVSIHLLPYHDAGSGKYARLDLSYKGVKMAPPSPERLDEIKKIFTGFGFSDIRTGG